LARFDNTECDLEKEILEAKKTKTTVSTHQTLNIQDFKHFICTTKDKVVVMQEKQLNVFY
jgi:hypothetical protein